MAALGRAVRGVGNGVGHHVGNDAGLAVLALLLPIARLRSFLLRQAT
jgi:hypothetical protein